MKLFKDTDNIVLSLKLPDKDIAQFPTATVYDNNTNIVNTYTLTNLGTKGYYVNVLAPATLPVGSYTVIYEVFRNAGHTQPSNKYTDSEEFLRIENYQTTIQNQVDQIIDNVDDLDAQVAN